jgi:hypothetical protein
MGIWLFAAAVISFVPSGRLAVFDSLPIAHSP